jgi:hypothetical protein
MCTYCNTKNYRKIYENHIGSIPKEADGRTYEIHHIDSNHNNNSPSNLIAVTIQEHYDIHYAQSDFGACFWMATQRMNKTPDELSELASKANLKRVEKGIHIFQKRLDGSSVTGDRVKDGTHPFIGGSIQRKSNQERVKNGTHHLLPGDIQRDEQNKRMQNGTHNFIGLNESRITDKTHNFLIRSDGSSFSKDRVKNGTHESQIKMCCIICRKESNLILFSRWHKNC